MSYTMAKLEVTDAAYEEIEKKLREAGYDHVFLSDGGIDMTHIALVKKEELVKDKENTVWWEAKEITVSVPSPFNTEEGRIVLRTPTDDTSESIKNLKVGSEIDVRLTVRPGGFLIGEIQGYDEFPKDPGPEITIIGIIKNEDEDNVIRIHWISTATAKKTGLEIGPDFKMPEGHGN